MNITDIKMVTAMLTIIMDDARERNENRTADQIKTVIDVLSDKAKDEEKR